MLIVHVRQTGPANYLFDTCVNEHPRAVRAAQVRHVHRGPAQRGTGGVRDEVLFCVRRPEILAGALHPARQVFHASRQAIVARREDGPTVRGHGNCADLGGGVFRPLRHDRRHIKEPLGPFGHQKHTVLQLLP